MTPAALDAAGRASGAVGAKQHSGSDIDTSLKQRSGSDIDTSLKQRSGSDAEIDLLHVAVPEDPGVRAAFTCRTSGAGDGNQSLLVGGGDAAAARRAALAAVAADADRAVFMQQVHGGRVAVVDDADAGRGLVDHRDAIRDVDGLVTSTIDLPLVVLVADCVPVILVAPRRAVAAVHAGRRGVAAEVVVHAVDAVAPGDPSEVVAVIGPAIGGCCYEVPATMAAEVTARWPQAGAATTWGAPALDLPAAVEAQLRATGVGRVRRVGSCTRCSSGRWFSHRAATAGVAPHGRQAGIVVRSGDAGVPPEGGHDRSLESP